MVPSHLPAARSRGRVVGQMPLAGVHPAMVGEVRAVSLASEDEEEGDCPMDQQPCGDTHTPTNECILIN